MSIDDNPNGVQSDYNGLRIPYHVGIVMDGNGRWAPTTANHRVFGHRAGTDNIRRIARSVDQRRHQNYDLRLRLKTGTGRLLEVRPDAASQPHHP